MSSNGHRDDDPKADGGAPNPAQAQPETGDPAAKAAGEADQTATHAVDGDTVDDDPHDGDEVEGDEHDGDDPSAYRVPAPESADLERIELPDDELAALIEQPLSLELRDDLERVVPSLPATAFVQITRRVRDEGRLELVLPHAAPDQLCALLDLDAWEKDNWVEPRGRAWLAAIADAYREQGKARGSLFALVLAMDPELWMLGLGTGTTIVEIDPEDDESKQRALDGLDETLYPWTTPDGMFVVAVPDDEHGRQALLTLIAIYDDDLGAGMRFVAGLATMLRGAVEEDQLRWRRGRLADLGFPSWEEAMTLFKPLAREAALAAPSTSPTAPLGSNAAAVQALPTPASPLPEGRLRAVMRALPAAEHGVRVREFMLLTNELMAAQRFEPGDGTLQRRAIVQAVATIELGLELLMPHAPRAPIDASDDDGPRLAFLADRLVAIGMRGLFRLGYGPLAKLRKAALALHREGRISLSSPGSLLDRPWGPIVQALTAWFPELPILEDGDVPKPSLAPMRSLDDLARATQRLGQAAALPALAFEAAAFGISPEWVTRVDEPARMQLGDLIRTALIVALREPGTSFRPLDRDDVAWAATNLVRHDKLVPELRATIAARCEAIGQLAHANAIADVLLLRLGGELAALERDERGRPDLTRLGGFLTIQSVSMWLATTAGMPAAE